MIWLDAAKEAIYNNKKIRPDYDVNTDHFIEWDGEKFIDQVGKIVEVNWEWNVFCEDWLNMRWYILPEFKKKTESKAYEKKCIASACCDNVWINCKHSVQDENCDIWCSKVI